MHAVFVLGFLNSYTLPIVSFMLSRLHPSCKRNTFFFIHCCRNNSVLCTDSISFPLSLLLTFYNCELINFWSASPTQAPKQTTELSLKSRGLPGRVIVLSSSGTLHSITDNSFSNDLELLIWESTDKLTNLWMSLVERTSIFFLSFCSHFTDASPIPGFCLCAIICQFLDHSLLCSNRSSFRKLN